MQNLPITLAIADDQAIVRKGIIQILKENNIQIMIEAEDGQQLVSALTKAAPFPDICVLDINMPVMNGYEALVKIKEKWPGQKVIILSTYNNDYMTAKMHQAGANGYVTKTAEPAELYAAVHDVHNTGFHFPEGFKPIEKKEKRTKTAAFSETILRFISLCCSELTYKEIANKMSVSPRTVDDYRNEAFTKLHIKTRTAIVMYALEMGIVYLPCPKVK